MNGLRLRFAWAAIALLCSPLIARAQAGNNCWGWAAYCASDGYYANGTVYGMSLSYSMDVVYTVAQAVVVDGQGGRYGQSQQVGDWGMVAAYVSAWVSDGWYYIDGWHWFYLEWEDSDGESWSNWIRAGDEMSETPWIDSINPSTWTAGSTQYFDISGGGFGGAPSISVTGDVGSCGIISSTDTSISAWVDLSSSSGGTAEVTVTSNGYNGMPFYPGPYNESPTSPSAEAQIEAAPALSCSPQSVTRGAAVTCIVDHASAAIVAGWSFSDGGPPVTGPSQSLTWSGVMVASGTVTATVNGVPLTASITVNRRSWHTQPADPVGVANGTFTTLPVPPQPTGDDAGLGEFNWELAYNGTSTETIPGGPNSGYIYYPNAPTFSNNFFNYIINPDLADQNSVFSLHQCGSGGWISWSNLFAQTKRHEYDSSTASHWAYYVTAFNGNNFGDYVEARVATPGTDLSAFNSATASGASALLSAIGSAAKVEPPAVNEGTSGNFLGNINYGPPHAQSYAACSN